MSARRSTRASNDRVESLAPNLAHVLAVIALAVFAASYAPLGEREEGPRELRSISLKAATLIFELSSLIEERELTRLYTLLTLNERSEA